MKPVIAISITKVTTSETHSQPKKWPISGSAKWASKSCPKAVSRVKNSSPNPMNTNQCAAPTQVHCSIRVCPRVSRTKVAVRAPGRSSRLAG